MNADERNPKPLKHGGTEDAEEQGMVTLTLRSGIADCTKVLAFPWCEISSTMVRSGMTTLNDFKETVRQQADIVRVIGDYIKLKKACPQNFVGLCPFHGEKTPSFSVHATRQYFHCFGCGKSGDVFKFVQEHENITFPEAVRMVAQKLGIPLPKAAYSTPGEAKDAQLRGQLLEIHERAVTFFQECLRRPEGARAREYLLGRGLDEETIARFRIGYASDSGFLLRDRLKNEFDEEVLRESGLFSWKQDEGAPSLSVRSVDGQGGDSDSPPSLEASSPKPTTLP